MAVSTLKRKVEAALADQWARPVVNSVRISIPVPPSVNALTRNVTPAERARATAVGRKIPGRVKTDHYRVWLQGAGVSVNQQRPGRIVGGYSLTVLIPRSETSMDLGNAEKAISDLLQAHGIIENDRKAEWITFGWTSIGTDCVVTVETFGSNAA